MYEEGIYEGCAGRGRERVGMKMETGEREFFQKKKFNNEIVRVYIYFLLLSISISISPFSSPNNNNKKRNRYIS